MKKTIFFLVATWLIYFMAGCSNSPDKLLENNDTRSQVISTLLKNEQYHKELMDSMMKQMNSAEMMHKMMEGGNKMMQMMKEDSSMRNSMMGQMMTMANKDSMMCSKMMDMMMSQPNISKQIMNAQKKKEVKDTVDHLKHHQK